MFDIFYLDKCVGTAKVKKEGLYYLFTCTCTLPFEGKFRVKVSDGENERDLGICYPTGNGFSLQSRVPAKYINGDSLRFSLISNEDSDYIVRSGKPFAHLDEIEAARLEITNGQAKIIIDSAPNQWDSDQSQECLNKSELP